LVISAEESTECGGYSLEFSCAKFHKQKLYLYRSKYRPVAPKAKISKVEEPLLDYLPRKFLIHHSFESKEAEELSAMAKLSPIEILTQLRQMINLAYGMHGYDPDKLPTKHSIRIGGYL
jgi:hypothetical protein